MKSFLLTVLSIPIVIAVAQAMQLSTEKPGTPVPLQRAGTKLAKAWQSARDSVVPKALPISAAAINSDYRVDKPCLLEASELDNVLGGVLSNKGQTIIDRCKRAGIDPLFVAGVFAHESANGDSRLAHSANNIAGIYDSKRRCFREFDSVDDCIGYSIDLLARQYVKRGRKTIGAIQQVYCPVGAANDPTSVNKHWRSGVVRWMTRFVNGDQALYVSN